MQDLVNAVEDARLEAAQEKAARAMLLALRTVIQMWHDEKITLRPPLAVTIMTAIQTAEAAGIK
jgi:hypothetical protein